MYSRFYTPLMKSLKTILKEHQEALAEIEKARADAEEKERVKAQSAWQAEAQKSQEEAAAFRAEVVKLYSQIETWLKDEKGLVFEKDPYRATARLTVDKVRLLFVPASGSPKEVQVGVDLSTLPWNNLQALFGFLALHDGVWYRRRENSIRPLNQSEFNDLLVAGLETARKPIQI